MPYQGPSGKQYCNDCSKSDITRDIEAAARGIKSVLAKQVWPGLEYDPEILPITDQDRKQAQAALAAIDYAGKLSRIAELEAEVERLRGIIVTAHGRLHQDAYGAECSTQRRLNTIYILEEALTPPADQEKKDE